MGRGGRTGERLEMVPGEVGNYTLVVVDEIGSWVARIECLCLGVLPSILSADPTLSSGRCCEPNRLPPGAIWLSSVEIHLSTWHVNK